MPQLAKNAPQTERVYLLLRGINSLNSTYKSKVSDPTVSPNIAILSFNIKAKHEITKLTCVWLRGKSY